MKRCPTCQRRYADDTLNFCLEDGTQLDTVNPSTDETLTLDAGEPPPTEILDPALAPTIKGHARPAATARQEARATRREEAHNFAAVPASSPARSTTSVVAVTVVATILLLGLGGLGAWLLLRDTGTEVSRDGNSNARPTPTNTPGSTPTSTSTPSPSPTSSTTPTPTPRPTETPGGGTASREVAGALEGWRRTMSTPSVAEHMAYYANTLHTYYNASNVDVQMVRNNVARAFSTYDSRDVRISNLQIEVDPSGERAVATFDKTFEFRGAGKTYAASGLNRFWFEKIGGRWLITGEKDLKIYYVNK
ncbi:MAG TPA: nuclear transport factor 2 family protein [Pyrinomonadaceae bacterium]|nr:nuclear transport factor 2 family protein [Pyrinomonadaceae bacterium]